MNNSNTGVALDYYQNLTNYAKNTEGFTYTVGNPGTSTLSPYVNSGAADNMVINETGMDSHHSPPIISDLQNDTFSSTFAGYLGYDKHDFSFLVYNQSASTGLPSSTTIGNQSNYVGLMFYSNTTSCCPFDVWGKIPPYLTNLAAVLDNKTSVITINSTGPSGPVTGLLVQVSQKGNLVPAGYTPYSYLGMQGVTYVFTPQNSATCTFHNWKDTGSTTPARTVVVTSSSQVLTANYTGTNCK